MRQKLAGHGETDEIAGLLSHLEDIGLLSDARFAQSFVRLRAPRFGAARLRHELRTRGVSSEIIDTAIAAETGTGEAAELIRAREIWRRKFGCAPADAREYARQARFLQSRGFGTDTVRRLLKSPGE